MRKFRGLMCQCDKKMISRGCDGVNLCACRNLHLLEDQNSRSDKVTITTGASAYLGGYALKGAPASKSLRLSDDFLAQVRNVYDALGGGQEQERAHQLFTNYGTHYINRVWYGGLGESRIPPFALPLAHLPTVL